ncbi:Fic family protein [Bifidobacterium pseudolongum]|uniref:Death-on-curing protein n=1 Tax=Bifidobacterium pseudolongum subsp. globosum TaxID=1690 RepID=A0A2N3R7S6_9BIFI|nr:Fic family protein [Bifidobacterium pseudolongum]PKV05397.1 death-on-curing protein [Bifidobacterium pseudolongum subsp. globosum]
MHAAEPNAEPIELDGEQMRMDALAESVFEVYLGTIRGTGLDITPTAPAAVDEAILGRVQSVLGATFLTFFGIAPAQRYADVFAQIADFATRFAKDHIFPDGNKRTAVKMSLAILKMRGWDVRACDASEPERNELYQWVQDIVTGRGSAEELAAFLHEHAVWVKDQSICNGGMPLTPSVSETRAGESVTARTLSRNPETGRMVLPSDWDDPEDNAYDSL